MPVSCRRFKLNDPRIAIIDYKMCNLFSVEHACKAVGLNPVITSDISEINSADGIILPGVGAFGDAISNIREHKLDTVIENVIAKGKPFLGICLGFQLLFQKSEEFGIFDGLGLVPGKVKRIPIEWDQKKLKVPQIAWNKIFIQKPSSILDGIRDEEYMYFVHSFFVDPKDESWILTKTSYNGFMYCSSIEQDNIFACQFHPEKSSKEGIKIYSNWAKKFNN